MFKIFPFHKFYGNKLINSPFSLYGLLSLDFLHDAGLSCCTKVRVYFLSIFFFFQFLGQQISEELIPDLNQISENSDPTELGRLLQLILGCAVNCERKQGTYYLNLCKKQETASGGCKDGRDVETLLFYDSKSLFYYVPSLF